MKSNLRFFSRYTICGTPFILLMICFILRLSFYKLIEPISIFPDSGSYMHYTIAASSHLRTPFYPFFIKTVGFLTQSSSLLMIAYVQDLLSFVSIFLFYKICQMLFRSEWVVFVATVLYGCLPSIINFNHAILTESLSITFVVILTYLVVNLLKTEKFRVGGLLLGIFPFVLIMLRPSFLFVLPIIGCLFIYLIFISQDKRKFSIFGLCGVIVSFIMVLLYCYINQIYHNTFTISLVWAANQIFIMQRDGISNCSIDPELSQLISKPQAGYEIANHIAYEMDYGRVKNFIQQCIGANFHDYIKARLTQFYLWFLWGGNIGELYYNENLKENNYLLAKKLNDIFNMTYLTFYLLVLCDLLLQAYLFLLKKQFDIARIFIFLILFCQILTVTIGGATEWGRLLTPVFPLLILVMFYYLDLYFNSIKSLEFVKKP